MRERVLRFKRRARQENAGQRRKRYSAALRSEAVGILAVRRGEGSGIMAVAGELGIGGVTLARWAREATMAGAAAPFRRVEIKCEPSETGVGLRLVTPRGFVVEGLDLPGVAALLGAL